MFGHINIHVYPNGMAYYHGNLPDTYQDIVTSLYTMSCRFAKTEY